ncbi:MAG: heme lyase CcmF/NrfE family subunit [Nitrosomonadales bacterium]|nr:heme lyase CcmF/NrfE family subunit [Nitrosomonadales bacterium]
MIPEIGHFSLIVALFVALSLGVLPILGAARGNSVLMGMARPLAYGQFVFVAIAFGCLMASFLASDFSVLYVSQHSNSQLPTIYKIAAIWGGHEGSLLLWVTNLSVWAVVVSLNSKHLPQEMVARVLGVMGLIAVGFFLFMLFTSNPFDRLIPAAEEGLDLNPLLQDPGLAIHPPMLYTGYVGFSVAFAFAISALLGGRLDATWARWSRPWTTVAWVFLTLGIMLGSWWAYYELGWGGWWFWDPVENASFMPWLVGTALIHSLAVTEKRAAFKSWTVLLAIAAFSLSLLGTFLVRSGVLTSVHAFATDPKRGIFILGFLVAVIGSSLLLFAWRAPKIGLGDKLMGLGPLARWKKFALPELAKRVRWAFASSLVIALLLPFVMGKWTPLISLGYLMAFWIVTTILVSLGQRLAGEGGLIKRIRAQSLSYYGMQFAHFGVAVFIIGVTMVKGYEVERDVRMEMGDTVEANGFVFRLESVEGTKGPNYMAAQGRVSISKDGKPVTVLFPEKRQYNASGMPMTEAAIDTGFIRDLYVSMGEQIPGAVEAWAIRVYYKPFVDWIWVGCVFMALGGALAISDRRYRIKMKKPSALVEGISPTGGAVAEGKAS